MPLSQKQHDELRALLRDILGNQKLRYSGPLITGLLRELGLEDCPTATSKAERLRGAVDASSDEQVFTAAHRALGILMLMVGERDALQEALWRVEEKETFGFFEQGPSLLENIEKHYVKDPDWDVLTMFDQLDAFKASDARFCRLIEGLASSSVRPDEEALCAFIAQGSGRSSTSTLRCVFRNRSRRRRLSSR